jgi:mono/diheme cytochrome c family protein
MFVNRLASSAARCIPKNKETRAAWITSLLLSIGLLLLPHVFKLDGRQHANWQQFLGRFHPLAVHLPIGFLVLLPLLEIGGAFRFALRETAGFVLGLALAACLGSIALGYLLAYGSGDSGAGVTRHMWGGITLSIGVLICVLARPSWSSGEVPHVYPILLTAVLLTLVWTAHQGGSLTHGTDYLTEYMPAPLKRWTKSHVSGVDASNAGSFYARHIHPVFDANCVACHGESKTRGGLRLDSYDWLMKGGKDGAVIVDGDPAKSLLLQRITLPINDKHYMPAEGKPPLEPEEIAWIRAWIQQGASPSIANLDGISIHEEHVAEPLQPVGDYSALLPEIHQIDGAQGVKIVPVSSKPSDGLILNTVDIAAHFDDAQLAKIQEFAPYIVEADLARTAVTDASFDTLGKFTHLRALDLAGTAVTGAGLTKLAGLTQLTYLNLSGTKVTSAAVAPLGSMKNLHHLYLFNSPAEPASAMNAMQPIARNVQ